MKLKKFAAMMLAGVMAVSMLAGCAEGGKKEDDKDPVVTTGMTGSVIAALDEDTTENVKFAADSNLQSVLEKAVKNVGYNGLNNTADIANTMIGIDSDLGKYAQMPAVGINDNTEKTDKEEQSVVGVVCVPGEGMNESSVAKKLAAAIDAEKVAGNKNNGWADLKEYSKDYTDDDGETYWYDFEYTAGVASVEVSDAVTGQTTYVVAYTVTRTPTQTYKHA